MPLPGAERATRWTTWCRRQGLMPLAFPARFEVCWRHSGRQQYFDGFLPPHPAPLPRGEGESSAASLKPSASAMHCRWRGIPPLPEGEGWGEGERRNRLAIAFDSDLCFPKLTSRFLANWNALAREFKWRLPWRYAHYQRWDVATACSQRRPCHTLSGALAGPSRSTKLWPMLTGTGRLVHQDPAAPG
jgi:hypothetical protein